MMSAYAALGSSPNIQYIDMPEQIRGSYQYFTESDGSFEDPIGFNEEFESNVKTEEYETKIA